MLAPTESQIKSLAKDNPDIAWKNWQDLSWVLDQSPENLCGAAATVAVETAHTFCPIAEMGNADYFSRVYGHRADYQVDSKGLWRWRGRGYIQLTGKSNYQDIAEHLHIPELMANPDLALDPFNAIQIFSVYWSRHGLPTKCQKAAITKDWAPVRIAVNGGTNGYKCFLDALRIFGATV